MKTYNDIGVGIPEIHLPRPGTDLQKWAIIACDQYTSEPEYWERVQREVGDAPSTLNLVFPEIYLTQPHKDERIRSIQATMRRYLADGLLVPRAGPVYVERSVGGKSRKGLLLCLDLERYDYNKGSSSLIRATEGTIVDRLPPRMAIREGAALELPHILVLIDDPGRTVIEPLGADSKQRELLYDVDLMFGSGHLTGFGISPTAEERAIAGLKQLAVEADFQTKYDVEPGAPVLLFAMGDGNHSLATAKAVWEKLKAGGQTDHPARYALVEIENVHDEGLHFEPIHRVLFNLRQDLITALMAGLNGHVLVSEVATVDQMVDRVEGDHGITQRVGLLQGQSDKPFILEFQKPTSSLAVGTLQTFLDAFVEGGGADKIDYVHGRAALEQLASESANAGFYLPPMHKSALFRTVIQDGALPRKTFSMGEASEKRFYMEARKIA